MLVAGQHPVVAAQDLDEQLVAGLSRLLRILIDGGACLKVDAVDLPGSVRGGAAASLSVFSSSYQILGVPRRTLKTSNTAVNSQIPQKNRASEPRQLTRLLRFSVRFREVVVRQRNLSIDG
jgi:hypothetical protein